MTAEAPGRMLRLVLQPGWEPDADGGRSGLLAADPRARTLVRVLVSYPEVRYVVPDGIAVDADADPRLLETVGRFLARQDWLVLSVSLT